MTESVEQANSGESLSDSNINRAGSDAQIKNTQINITNRSNLDNNNSSISSRTSTVAAIVELEARTLTMPESKAFGWGKYQPECLQRFCTPKWALFWLCWGGAMQGIIVNGFVNVVITTIERRFGLRSSETGLVASGYDIASFLSSVPIGYFGGRLSASKPRFIAWGITIIGIGSLIFALPHFLVGPYRAGSADTNVCDLETNNTLHQSCTKLSQEQAHPSDAENLKWTLWFFFAAQLLQGLGAAPLFTLGVTFIDENVSKKMSSVYLGIFYTMAIIGPAIGFVLGGQLLLIYTDFLTVDANKLGLTSGSNVWIGAWWIGFVFTAVCCFLLAIPIFGYPKKLPGAQAIQQNKISEEYNASVSKTDKSLTKLKEMPKAFVLLLKNPTFFFLNLAGGSEGLIIAGFATFLPKQIENQFAISPVFSALLVGLITVPAGGGGTFLGGYLIKKFNLTCSGIIRMCLAATIIATCFTTAFLLSCPNMPFAGVTIEYRNANSKHSSLSNNLAPVYLDDDKADFKYFQLQLDAPCNSHCGCGKTNYEPICGSDNIAYYSPCYAGCKGESVGNSTKMYTNCACILPTATSENATVPLFDATNATCTSRCQYLPYFVALCFLLMFFTFLATMPALSATLRCVHEDQRSFALGIQWIKVRLLGTIPAPLLFGTLIDKTCILWHDSCGDQEGACLVYDNETMNRYMWILALVGKLGSAGFFFAAWWFYIPPKKPESDDLPETVEECRDVM